MAGRGPERPEAAGGRAQGEGRAKEEPLEAAWAHLLEHWEEEAAHEAFLTLCVQMDRLAEAGRRYRQIRESDPARAEEAARRIDRLLALAAAGLRAQRTDPEVARRRARRVLLAVASLLFAVLVGAVLLLAAPGCGGGAGGTTSRTESASSGGTMSPRALAPEPLEGLSRRATWGELLDALRQGRLRPRPQGCLLGSGPGGLLRLGTEPAPALRPLPAAREHGPLLERATSAAVLTRWGLLGNPEAPLLVATLTAHPPPRPRAAAVLLVGERGAWLLGAGPGGGRRRLERVVQVGQALGGTGRPGLLVVVPPAGLSLGRLAEALEALAQVPGLPPIVLGVALPSGTRLPESARPGRFRCGATPESGGDPGGGAAASRAPPRSVPGVPSLLEALRELGRGCVAEAAERGTPPGALRLRVDVGRGGAVAACLLEDEPADPRLAGCLVAGAERLRVAADVEEPLRVELPLRLRVPGGVAAPRPWCPAGPEAAPASGGPTRTP